MVAEPGQQTPGRRPMSITTGAYAGAPGVDLHREEDAEVVEHRRDGRPAEHLEVRHAEVLGDDEGRRTQGRRGEDRADAGRGQHAAGPLRRVAGPAQEGPGDRADADRRRRAGAGDGAEQEPGGDGRAPGGGARAPEGGGGELHEEPAGPGEVQHRAVDGEQHDVRRGDVERGAVEAAVGVVERVDNLARSRARHGPPARTGEATRRSSRSRGKQADRRQDPAGRAPARLQQQEQQDGAHRHVRRHQQTLPVEEGVVPAATPSRAGRQHRVEAG